MAESKNSARRTQAAARTRKALDLRIAGATYERIASALGISKSAAHKAVARGMNSIRANNESTAQELRDLEVARLDRMLVGLWNGARNGDAQAVDRVLRIMERRAKLLGLDSPASLEVSGPAGGPIETASDSREALRDMLRDPKAASHLRALAELQSQPKGDDDDEGSE